MRYLRNGKKANKEAFKMHRRCEQIDKRRLETKKERVENGVYRAT